MQSQDAMTIIMAASASSGSINWGPTVDNITIFSDYTARTLAGQFSKTPLLIGNNDDESALFAVQAELMNVTGVSGAIVAAGNLNRFTCPSGNRANASVGLSLPTWRYRYFGEFPNTVLTTVPDSGAWHGSEVPVIFDTLPIGTGIPASTSAEVAIGKYIRGAWAAFAKNSTAGLITYEDGWPAYQPGAETLIRLAYNNLTGTNSVLPATYDAGCKVTFPISAANSTTSQKPTPTPTSATSRLITSVWMVAILAILVCL
jgi:carboxylesterase type B